MTALLGLAPENLGPPEPFTAIKLGPVWQCAEGTGEFLRPDYTLGWHVIAWCAQWLRSADGEDGWRFTFEQARFILWFYAIDQRGRWIYRDSVIQMVKGWGKDPIAAVICAVELVGPCRLGGWDAEGQPVAVPLKREPWVQIVGSAREQTKNTMSFLQGIFTKAAIAKYDIQINKEIIWALGGTARLEVVTSAPRTMEGNRPSFVVLNEIHHWIASNDGIELNKVIARNLVKMRKPTTKGAHTLSITNAYNPAEESVGQRTRENYETELAKGVSRTLYHSLEAPEEVPLIPDYTRLDEHGNRIREFDEFDIMIPPDRETIKAHIEAILVVLGGDAHWLDPEETTDEILKTDSDMGDSRRFYLNSVVTGDEKYLAHGDIDATVHPLLKPVREAGERGDVLRVGWKIVLPSDPVVMFFDGSKSDDATAIVGCRISDGYLFTIGIWERPPKARAGLTWLAPRGEISGRVHEAFKRFNIVAFWGDPSHTRDDQSSTRYWDAVIDEWHTEYQTRLKYWAVQGGDHLSSVMWDMTDPAKQRLFSEAVVRFGDEMDLQTVRWDGHPALRSHFRNAHKSWGRSGLSIRKPSRGGRRKIDLAVCAVGAKMLARLVSNKGLDDDNQGAGNIWVPRSRR